jgi:iron complex transport system ATP-binding protein
MGSTQLLDRVDAIFTPGKLTCIIGPNGAGKTTLLKTITGEFVPDSGRVTIDEISDLRERRRHIAFAPQSSSPSEDLTVMEMMALGRFNPTMKWISRLNEEDKILIAGSVEATGIGDLMHRKVSSLSGGEMQRTWIAFCLVQNKPYLLLDESLSAVDFISRRRYFNLLRKLVKQQRSVILVTHDLGMVNEFADSVLLINRGSVCYSGPAGDDLDLVLTEPFCNISKPELVSQTPENSE